MPEDNTQMSAGALTPDLMYTGKNTQPSKRIINGANASNPAIPMPVADPEPAKPIKCAVPIFEAKRLAPIGMKCIVRPARKYPPTLFRLVLDLDDLGDKSK